jgi:hypothetical protein
MSQNTGKTSLKPLSRLSCINPRTYFKATEHAPRIHHDDGVSARSTLIFVHGQQRANKTFATPQINIDIFSQQLSRASHRGFVLANQQIVRAPLLSVLQCIKRTAARGRSSVTTRPSHSAAIVM